LKYEKVSVPLVIWKPWAVWFDVNFQPGSVSAPSVGCPVIWSSSSANPAGID
jgi:hypothetical protein